MELRIIEKSELQVFVTGLMKDYRVEGVRRKNGTFVYATIGGPEELCLDFDRTLIPAKKYFLPQKETLFKFKTGPSPEATPVLENTPFVLFGVHPYDLKAICQMDRIFSLGVPDPHYLKRREAALVIGVDPACVAPRSFWADIDAATVSWGFDLMLTDLGERFAVELGSQKGRGLLSDFAKSRKATTAEANERVVRRSRIFNASMKEKSLKFPKREIPRLLEQAWNNPLWEEKASRCLSCGSCNLVCPTCYCFDVQDNLDLNLVQGERFRRWDGCLLEDFAVVATGENFRGTRASRYRHRFFKKGLYLFRVLGDVACVGCGRCSSACLPDIADPVDVFNEIKEDDK
jgi:ferredoxin